MKAKLTVQQKAGNIIKEMQDYGLAPEQMLEVIQLSRKKVQRIKR